ncbi:MAG TPA: hypothetical protein VD947_01525, partial [Patescibacteria group bacterium]|nr:hypothetical protein [Patescibacteria group bacterium]
SGGDSNDEEHFYMNVYANFGESDDTKFYDCRYNVIPTVGSTSDFTTVTFDPTQSYSVDTRNTSPYPCPASPADMDLLSPSSNIRMFSLNVGDTSANDAGLDGYLDNVVVTILNGDTTIYDFEEAPVTLSSKNDCKKGGWQDSEAPVFKNQGDCVSHFASSGSQR